VTGDEPTGTLLDLLRAPLAETGLDLEGVEISSAGRRRVVRVLVDQDGGVTLDDLAAATTVVGDQIDRTTALGESPYTLEVTSPGIDRPLTAPRHWRRNVDRLVAVSFVDGATVTGRIVAAAEDGATVEVDGEPRQIGYDDVAKARVQIEFNRPRPSGKG
jgi:ribosome maturation factor RimP